MRLVRVSHGHHQVLMQVLGDCWPAAGCADEQLVRQQSHREGMDFWAGVQGPWGKETGADRQLSVVEEVHCHLAVWVAGMVVVHFRLECSVAEIPMRTLAVEQSTHWVVELGILQVEREKKRPGMSRKKMIHIFHGGIIKRNFK